MHEISKDGVRGVVGCRDLKACGRFEWVGGWSGAGRYLGHDVIVCRSSFRMFVAGTSFRRLQTKVLVSLILDVRFGACDPVIQVT